MPVSNDFFGVWKTLLIGTSLVLGTTASRKREMETSPLPLLQGTPKNRVFSIGSIKEVINVSAPMLVGSASVIDGRSLLARQIKNALSTQAILPVVTSASVSVTSEQGASVSVALLSDGKPPVDVQHLPFALYGDLNSALTVYNSAGSPVTIATTSMPHYLLDTSQVGITPTRVARHYDFRVCLGGYMYFITEAQIAVAVGTKELNFLAGNDPAIYGSNGQYPDSGTITTGSEPWAAWGTQYPWIGVNSISISGGGKAIALLHDYDADGDFFDNEAAVASYYTVDGTPNGAKDEAVNMSWLGSELTLQNPGNTVASAQNFSFQIWSPTANSGSGGWISLFDDPDNPGTPVVNLEKSVITEHNLSVTTQLIEVDFKFVCWVI